MQDTGGAWFRCRGYHKYTPVFPSQCSHCEQAFTARDTTATRHGSPLQPQETELPPEVNGSFGPELAVVIAYLTVTCPMPRRVVPDSLEQILEDSVESGFDRTMLNKKQKQNPARGVPE